MQQGMINPLCVLLTLFLVLSRSDVFRATNQNARFSHGKSSFWSSAPRRQPSFCNRHVNRAHASLDDHGRESSGISQDRASSSEGEHPLIEDPAAYPDTSRLSSKIPNRKDDVVIRFRGDRELPIPQAQRYDSSDWGHILRRTVTSEVLQRIRGPVLTNFCWALAVWGVHKYFQVQIVSFVVAHSLLGSAMGMLLVFRTNTAYERFWEGRTIWEAVLARSRNLARLCTLYRNEVTKKKVERIANLICVFAALLAAHLGATFPDYFSHLITQEDIAQLNRVGNRPLHILNMIGEEIKTTPDQKAGNQTLFSSRERERLLREVDKMSKHIGECERLIQTPVPLNYVRHTSRFLSIWCLTLPVALVANFGAFVVPVMVLVSWGLFAIHEIGLMIEEPFRRALDLDVIINTVYADVFELGRMPQWRKWTKKAVKRSDQLAANAAAVRKSKQQTAAQPVQRSKHRSVMSLPLSPWRRWFQFNRQ